MKQKNVLILLAASMVMLIAIAVQSQRAAAQYVVVDTTWQSKVDGWVMETASANRSNQQTEFLVVLAAQADIGGAEAFTSKEEKGQYVYDTLSQLAADTQAPVIAELDAMGVEYRAYWVNNMIWVRGDMAVIEAMAVRDDVARIDGNKPSRMDEPIQEAGNAVYAPTAIEWGVNRIHAPAVWALGYNGTGIVVGGQDTGYRYTHETIASQYRGNGGSHDYNWHDSIHATGSSCGADSPIPCDDNGHGTHTMGTMVGDDGGSNQVGIAPGAKWIGCRNMNAGVGTPATYSECFQWFIAPTHVDGTNPDPAMAPHVINNSWGCPTDEGCAWDSLQTVVSNTRAAGIVVVVSAGNAGSSCNTVNDPPAIYDDSYSIGATESSDSIASFSSRGPADDTGLPKPDISAPGVNVRSGSNSSDSSYMTISGTSMAGPHVAGSVALLLSRAPSLIGNQTAVENLLNATADAQTSTQTCGGVPGSTIPNNTFGWGIVNVLEAVENAPITIDIAPAAQSVCISNNAAYAVDVYALSGITDTISLSANGYPTGTMALFSTSASMPPFTSTLTISDTAGATAGTYMIDVVGMTVSLTHTSTVSLVLDVAIPLSPTLTAPASGMTGVQTSPTYSWAASANALSYDIEIATDAAFANIVDSASGVMTTTYEAAIPLSPTTTYYWRVRANNGCGTGIYSTAYTFTTANIACTVYPGIGGAIADNSSTNFTINITNTGFINDVNVLNLVGIHTWVGDLDMQLASPAATSIQLRAQDCSLNDDFDINYDDEAAPGSPPCPPTDGGTYQPDGPGALADFDGEDLAGTWTLTITDNANQDTGTLNSWALEICYAGPADPIISVNPDALDNVQATNVQVTQTLSIGNVGMADLEWSIFEDSTSSCGSVNDILWITGLPTITSTVSAGNADMVDAIFDSAGMPNGVYTGTLCVDSNDLVTPQVMVPVTMTVVTPNYGVDLSGNDAQNGLPGEVMTYTLTVTNTGNVADIFNVTISNTWNTTATMVSVPVNYGTSSTFDVLVTIPVSANNGDSDVATITVTSDNDGSATDSADLTTTAVINYGVNLSGNDAMSGLPGAVMTYTLTITNMGDVADTFNVTISNTWNTTATMMSIPVNAGMSSTFDVMVTIPASANNGDSDMATVTVTSAIDGSATDSADLTTTAVINYGVNLSGNDAMSGLPSAVMTYTLTITNMGDVADTFNVTISNTWNTTATMMSIPVNAGMSSTFDVMVTIPATANNGDSDVATVTVTSAADGSVTDSADLTTTATVASTNYYIYLPVVLK